MSPSSTTNERTLLPAGQQRLAALLQITNPQSRLARIVDDARRQPAIAPELRTEENRVQGCLVRVWFVPSLVDGRCRFQCDSDAVSLKALGGLVANFYDGFTPEEILASPDSVLKQIGVLPQLAENRQRTLCRMEEQVRQFAKDQQQRMLSA